MRKKRWFFVLIIFIAAGWGNSQLQMTLQVAKGEKTPFGCWGDIGACDIPPPNTE